jgi:hypothetical protein
VGGGGSVAVGEIGVWVGDGALGGEGLRSGGFVGAGETSGEGKGVEDEGTVACAGVSVADGAVVGPDVGWSADLPA